MYAKRILDFSCTKLKIKLVIGGKRIDENNTSIGKI